MAGKFELGRRTMIACAALGVASMPLRTLASFVPTPAQTWGPFYPDALPMDRDADLLHVEGRSDVARGIPTHLIGRVLGLNGQPAAGIAVEIWQCDALGRYLHSRDRRRGEFDPAFQGYGRTITDAEGRYRFRTIKPVPYGSRTPHIHMAVRPRDGEPFATQIYVEGEKRNGTDFVLNRVSDSQARARLIVPFTASPDDDAELLARFDLVLGVIAAK